MEKEFVSYEQARALKELGFDEPCLCTYYTDSKLSRNPSNRMDDSPIDEEPYTWQNSKIHKYLTSAPLKQQVFRWFREKHDLYHSIGLDNSLKEDFNCDYQIINHSQLISKLETGFKSYEEAESACIDKLIELAKK